MHTVIASQRLGVESRRDCTENKETTTPSDPKRIQARRSTMKYLLATVAISAMIASSVAAQAAPKHSRQAQAARAQATTAAPSAHSANPSNDAYDANHYVGSDPDARIRADLLRDRTFN
jgi:hypothetical protein